jgi:hypothetical protein
VHLEANNKPHVHQKFEIFWTNIVSTMACPNFINGPKTGLRLLGVKELTNSKKPCYWNMIKLGILYLVTNRKRNKGILENLQLGEYWLLEKFPLHITILMLTDCKINP